MADPRNDIEIMEQSVQKATEAIGGLGGQLPAGSAAFWDHNPLPAIGADLSRAVAAVKAEEAKKQREILHLQEQKEKLDEKERKLGEKESEQRVKFDKEESEQKEKFDKEESEQKERFENRVKEVERRFEEREKELERRFEEKGREREKRFEEQGRRFEEQEREQREQKEKFKKKQQEKQKELDERESRLTTGGDDLKDREKRLEARETRVEGLLNGTLEQIREERKKLIDDLKEAGRLEERKATLEKAEKEVSAQREKNEAKEVTLTELSTNVNNFKRITDDESEEVERKAQGLRESEGRLDERERRLEKREGGLDERERRLEKREGGLEEREAQVNKLLVHKVQTCTVTIPLIESTLNRLQATLTSVHESAGELKAKLDDRYQDFVKDNDMITEESASLANMVIHLESLKALLRVRSGPLVIYPVVDPHTGTPTVVAAGTAAAAAAAAESSEFLSGGNTPKSPLSPGQKRKKVGTQRHSRKRSHGTLPHSSRGSPTGSSEEIEKPQQLEQGQSLKTVVGEAKGTEKASGETVAAAFAVGPAGPLPTTQKLRDDRKQASQTLPLLLKPSVVSQEARPPYSTTELPLVTPSSAAPEAQSLSTAVPEESSSTAVPQPVQPSSSTAPPPLQPSSTAAVPQPAQQSSSTAPPPVQPSSTAAVPQPTQSLLTQAPRQDLRTIWGQLEFAQPQVWTDDRVLAFQELLQRFQGVQTARNWPSRSLPRCAENQASGTECCWYASSVSRPGLTRFNQGNDRECTECASKSRICLRITHSTTPTKNWLVTLRSSSIGE